MKILFKIKEEEIQLIDEINFTKWLLLSYANFNFRVNSIIRAIKYKLIISIFIVGIILTVFSIGECFKVFFNLLVFLCVFYEYLKIILPTITLSKIFEKNIENMKQNLFMGEFQKMEANDRNLQDNYLEIYINAPEGIQMDPSWEYFYFFLIDDILIYKASLVILYFSFLFHQFFKCYISFYRKAKKLGKLKYVHYYLL